MSSAEETYRLDRPQYGSGRVEMPCVDEVLGIRKVLEALRGPDASNCQRLESPCYDASLSPVSGALSDGPVPAACSPVPACKVDTRGRQGSRLFRGVGDRSILLEAPSLPQEAGIRKPGSARVST